MGNHVGVDREPATLFDVLECKEESKEHEAKVKFNSKNNKNEFSSSLHLWRFYPEPENPQDIKNSPVSLSDSFKSFDSHHCYLILHIFLEGKHSSSSPSSPLPASSESDVTVSHLLSSSAEALTPRGLANCLEDAFSATSHAKVSETGLNYNIYIWNGRDSANMTRAVAMAKRFELVKALETRKLTQSLFLRADKIALTSVFRYDQNGSLGLGDDGTNNHLFQQLLRRDPLDFLLQGKATAPGLSTSNGKISTTFSRLHQIFPENGGGTPPTSPTKELQSRSKSEGSLKALIDHKNKDPTNNTHDTTEEEEQKSPRKKDKDSDSKKKKKNKKKDRRAGKLAGSKQTSVSTPSLVTKIPTLELSKKPAIGKLDIKKLDKTTPTEQEPPRGTDHLAAARKISLDAGLPVGRPVDEFELSENKIKSDKLKRFDIICSKITEDLYLGSQTVSRDKSLLKETGITHILNCAGSICPEYYPGEFVYRTLYLTDGVKEDILCLLYDVIEWIDEVVSSKGKIFIHCQQGVSRSSAITIGYLMWKKDWNYEEAQLFVKARRGVSSPNTGFICQLLFLEKRLHDPKRETRIYHVTNHSRHDTAFLVGKNTKSFPISEINGSNSTGCYIVQVPECFYIWVGGKCDEQAFEVAKQTVRRVQAFEKATQNVHIIHQGKEGEEFKKSVAMLSH